MKTSPLHLLCFIAFLTSAFLNAQLYTVSRYADDSGLPSRIVHDVIQDSSGFMWVAGNNGLYKFDGRSFKPYLAALKDTIGLRDNKINVVMQTMDQRIWVGTPKGLHVIENDQVNYVRLHDDPVEEQEYILDIFEDRAQNLWISTYGGLFLKEKGGDLVHFIPEIENASISKEVIWSVTEDQGGQIWIAAKEGPYTLDIQHPMEFTPILTVEHASINLENTDLFRFISYNDSLVLIASNRGLLKGVRQGKNLIEISKFTDTSGNYLDESHVSSLTIDQEGYIWVGTYKNYFKKYELTGGLVREVEVHSKNGLLGMTENIRELFVDHQKNIWMANSNGLYKLSLANDDFSVFPPGHAPECLPDFKGIYAMIEDRWGYIWINTPYQLYRLNKNDIIDGNCPDNYLVFENEHMQLSRNLYIDSRDRLWIGADGGLFVTQLQGEKTPMKFRRYTTADGLPHNWSYDILEYAKDSYWIGNYAGLVKLQLKSGNLNSPDFQTYTADLKRSDALINSQATDLEWDKNGQLWIGTFSGLSRMFDDDENGNFASYTSSFGQFNKLSNNSIKKIYKDKQDRLWIATQRGLNLYLSETDEFLQFGKDEDLPSEYILAIQEDSDGYFWIGTTNGILKARYNDETRQLTDKEYFTFKSGLADNIPYRNSILILEGYKILIGSREGISVYNNRREKESDVPFNLSLTGLQTTQKQEAGFKNVLDRYNDNQLVLKHFENSLLVNYAALDLTNPEYNTYRHKILPLSNGWIETGNNSELVYYNLNAGEYELLLDAKNAKGNSATEPIKLHITINPPMWKSNWAIFCYILLGVLLLRVLYVFRLRKKMSELERKTALERALIVEREQLRKENAADFHDELGSKVTKISLFLTLAERSLMESGDAMPWLAKIRENIRALSGGFRDLLWVIDPHKDSLTDTFLRLKDFGEDLFDNSKINFRVSGLEEIPEERLLDAQTKKQVVLIFKEAMTNCLKYSACHQVDLMFHSNGKFSTIVLEDDGKGFDPKIRSAGRGLQNMRTRTNQIGATLQIRSSGKGTCVRLERIPHTGDIR